MNRAHAALLVIVLGTAFCIGCKEKSKAPPFIVVNPEAGQQLASLLGAKKAPIDQMVAHFENVAKILEDNKDNPDRARELIQKYADDNRAELKALKRELDKMEEGKTDEEKAKLAADAMAKFGSIVERIMAVTTSNPKLGEAMKGLDFL